VVTWAGADLEISDGEGGLKLKKPGPFNSPPVWAYLTEK